MRAISAAGVAGALLLLALGAAPQRPVAARGPAATSKAPLLATMWRGDQYVLGRVDPLTLRPVRGRPAPLAGAVTPVNWARSPGGARLVVETRKDVRVIDLKTMRVVRRYDSGSGIVGLAWPTAGRILVVDSNGPSVEALAGKQGLWSRQLTGNLTAWAKLPGGVAVLLSPNQAIGPSTLAVVGADGSVRTVVLDRVLTGWTAPPQGSTDLGEARFAGLAVDPSGTRAYVVAAGSTVAEIDLASMGVTYHELRRELSLLGRFRNWLEPNASAKGMNGPTRVARAVGGVLAVSGYDERAWFDEHGDFQGTRMPVGLQLVDTGSWTVRSADATASALAVGAGRIIGLGTSLDSTGNGEQGHGLDGYGTDGRHSYHLLGNSIVYRVQTANGRGYVERGDGWVVFDLATGAVLARPSPQIIPTLLVP